jgi:hypothetical protein
MVGLKGIEHQAQFFTQGQETGIDLIKALMSIDIGLSLAK